MKSAYERLPQNTRRRILELLKRQGPLSAAVVGKELRITSMGARQQLHALEGDGLVEHRVEQRGMGRPGYYYCLTELGDELFPRTYPQMATSLLETIRILDGERGIERIFRKRTEQLEGEYRARMAEKDLEERVAELARIRSEQGYMADWKKLNKDTFLMREHNCAICQVARQCTQACSYELELFRRVLDDTHVTREAHILQGDRTCTYLIRRKGSSAHSGRKKSRRVRPSKNPSFTVSGRG